MQLEQKSRTIIQQLLQSHVAAFDAHCNRFLAEGLLLSLRLREITHPKLQLRQLPTTGGLHIDSTR